VNWKSAIPAGICKNQVSIDAIYSPFSTEPAIPYDWQQKPGDIMSYQIELLNGTKTITAVLTGVTSAQLTEKVNGGGILTIETVSAEMWPHLTGTARFLRVCDHDGDISGTYRIIETKIARTRERTALSATARHIILDTGAELFAGAVNCVRYTPVELMSLVLGYSAWNPGVVEPCAEIPFVRFEYESVFACLTRICSLTGGELILEEGRGEIGLLTRTGGDHGAVFRYGVNLRGVSRTVSTSRLANRVYGVGGGDPPLLLSANGAAYEEDGDSITTWGLCENVCHEPSLEYVVNLVQTPALDGVYTDGLCEHWSLRGIPTVSENTDPACILHGLSSQKIEGAAHGDGIEQTVTVTPGYVYSLLANLFLESGSVRVQISDGTSVYRRESPVTGTGFITVRIENWKANNGTVAIAIFQEGTAVSVFTVDSVQISQGSRALPFTEGNTADELRERTHEFLAARKDPEISYDIDLVDISGEESSGEGFGLGDTVTVIDQPLGISVETRIMERTVDMLRPWRVRVRLDNPSRSLTDVLAALRDEQEKGLRLQRSAFAEQSRAAEASSTRLGFSNTSFRFFGQITASAWNTLYWTAGTLRAGNAWYAISSGNFSAVQMGVTSYFYFDRTTPTTFCQTTDPLQAESEDRLLIFSAISLTMTDPCTIYPLGIIHD
jgi:hypothetical protein